MKKWIVILAILTAGLLPSCQGNNCFGPRGPWGWGPMPYGYGYGGMLMWAICLIVLGLVVYFVVQAQKTKGRTAAQGESALDILKKRYAKGEISKEDYERMKKDLES